MAWRNQENARWSMTAYYTKQPTLAVIEPAVKEKDGEEPEEKVRRVPFGFARALSEGADDAV